MSLNVFHLLVCLSMRALWRTMLAVFFSGTVFLLLTVTRVREQIVNELRKINMGARDAPPREPRRLAISASPIQTTATARS